MQIQTGLALLALLAAGFWFAAWVVIGVFLGRRWGVNEMVSAIETAVDDCSWNYWSTNDNIPRYVYRFGEAGTKAVGCEGIPTTSSKVRNVNVSRLVGVHKDHLRAVTLR